MGALCPGRTLTCTLNLMRSFEHGRFWLRMKRPVSAAPVSHGDRAQPSRSALWQLLRYAIVGAVITAGGQTIYYLGVEQVGLDPNISIGIAFVIGIAVGYFAHGWISFAGHGERDDHGRMGIRFIAVNLFGLAMNSFFVWLLVKHLHGATWWPIVPNIVLTPIATFWMHRKWTFGVRRPD